MCIRDRLYPTAIRLVHGVTGTGLLLAGQLVSALSMVVAVAGLVHLVEKDEGHSRSGTTAMLLVAFPTAFFLLADYPDSMALALAVWAFIAVRNRYWVLAGLAAAGLFLTKYYLAIVVVGPPLRVSLDPGLEDRRRPDPSPLPRHLDGERDGTVRLGDRRAPDRCGGLLVLAPVSYTHLRAHETDS